MIFDLLLTIGAILILGIVAQVVIASIFRWHPEDPDKSFPNG